MAVIVVHLTWEKVREFVEVGIGRWMDNVQRGYQDRYGAEQVGLGIEQSVVGAIAEGAVSEQFGLDWKPYLFGGIDVGPYEVRATSASRGRLILHKGDRDYCVFILAYVAKGQLPDVTLVGWTTGCNGKNEDWWGEANPAKPNGRLAYWVPPGRLRDMEELG